MVKAIFFDIDGTLVSFETHKIPASTQEALKALRDKGIKIFIATGRPQCLINNLGDLEFDGYITVNGSYCFTAGHQPIYKGCIPQEDIERLITFQQSHPVPFVFAYGNEMFVTEVNDRVQAVSDLIEIPIPPVASIEEARGKDDIVKIIDHRGRQIGVGRIGFDSAEARALQGKHGQKPMVHYDYLYLD